MNTQKLECEINGEKAVVFKEKAGVFSKNEIWVCLSAGYMYDADTFGSLIELMQEEWMNDKHLVG